MNIIFCLGDAANIPYPADTFDVVVSRLAIHHFSDPDPIVREMARVCRPAGRVALVDITAVDEVTQVEIGDRGGVWPKL